MALINCPECSKRVSDHAYTCPNCGYPIQNKTQTKRTPTRKTRYKKLPNGFGSIKCLSGNRRNPYAAFPPCAEFKENGSPILGKAIGYFSTYNEAYNALTEYNKSPFDTDNVRMTFEDVYKIYKQSKEFTSLKERSVVSKESAYKHCEKLYNKEVRKINKAMCEEVLDDVDTGSATKKNVLTIMKTVMRYAIDMNLIAKDCTENIVIEDGDPVIDRIPYSKTEISTIWQNSKKWQFQIILILLYSGLRVNELLKNTIDNVNLEEKWIYVPEHLAKNKTSIRKVPLSERILPFVKAFVENPNRGNKTNIILNDNGTVVTYNNFCARDLKKMNKCLEHEHKFHDTRHTFASLGTEAGIPELYLQKIMGHKPKSILYNTYTHISMEELLKYINMI
jgi:integrase